MNTEMKIFETEIKDVQDLQAKARKYDELKEAVGKIKSDLEDIDIYAYTAGHGDNYREYDFVKYHEVLDIINIRTEGLI